MAHICNIASKQNTENSPDVDSEIVPLAACQGQAKRQKRKNKMTKSNQRFELQRSFEQEQDINTLDSMQAEVPENDASSKQSQHSLKQSQDSTPAVPLQYDDFCLHFPKFIEYVLCKTIGDPAAYLKHLHKEKKKNNEAATAQIEAMLYFEALQNVLETIEQKCAMIENNRLDDVGENFKRLVKCFENLFKGPSINVTHAQGICAHHAHDINDINARVRFRCFCAH